jgi:hypothetical protein
MYSGSINYRYREIIQQYDDCSKLANCSCIYSASSFSILSFSRRILKVAFENSSS